MVVRFLYFLKGIPIVPGNRTLIYIGYSYNSWNFLVLIATDRAGSNDPGDPYLSSFPDTYSTFYIFTFVSNHVLVRYSNACNVIHNCKNMWKYDPALDKYRMTYGGYF